MHGERIRKASNVKSYYSLDLNAMRSTLANAQETGKSAKPVEIKLPTLNGKIERFAVYSSPVVVKSIADRYQLGSYVGIGIDDPAAYVRFSLAPNDFQSMVVRNGNYEFIEPQNTAKSVYGVFPKSDKDDPSFKCHGESLLTKEQISKLGKDRDFSNQADNFSRNSDQKFRTYRLAISVTGEYTQFFEGVPQALAAINATMTRVNGVFEKDFAIRLLLQDFPQLIYTNPSTDPYSPGSVGAQGAWSGELQTTLTNVIGNSAYDIGHLFGASGGGGSAGDIGNVCRNAAPSGDSSSKGSAYTSPGSGSPQGDTFDIDYVAHEMGHQFGAWHTFAHGIHSGSIAHMEPGSGSTIMGYAGITSANVQMNSDPYFHAVSVFQVQNYVNTQTCDISVPISNTPPVIAPMADKTIPKGTAFVLTAAATDPQNDPITYTWEQYDGATSAVTNVTANNTQGPKFRSITGSNLPYRYFPKLSMVMNGNLGSQAEWESVSNVARTMNFRVTVRDNNADVAQQQTQVGVQKVTVHANGPFKITSTKVYNNAPGPLTWDVVGTNAAPFNVANVKIDYTSDNGATWTEVAASTPNDGTEDFSFASFPTNTALKVRISAIGNVFYAIAPVTVSAIVACDGTAPVGLSFTGVTKTSANVTWDPVSGATTYILRYKKIADVSWTQVSVNASNYNMTGLIEATQYEAQVASVCKGTTGAFSVSANFTTLVPTYCDAGASSTSYEKISNVTFAGINNNSTSMAGYEDFTAVVGSVTRSSTYPFTASNIISYPSDEVRVWIDFNQDKDFDDEGELVLVTPKKPSPWTGSIVIPATANIGITRMRVRLHDDDFDSPNMTPCGDSMYGQVEDYTINIRTLATNENSLSDMQVYPNPAADILNVSKVSNNALYAIYNVSGQLISKGKITDNKVSVSKLQAGVYIISVEDKGNVEKVKFIKK